MPDFSVRSPLFEKMDAPSVPEQKLRQVLRELDVINRYLGGFSLVVNALRGLKLPAQEAISIMDIGCGGGDILKAIADWAAKQKRKVQLTGVDMNSVMTGYAAEYTKNYPNIRYVTMSVFNDRLMENPVDITTCSLFCHHFANKDLVVLVQRMYALARKAVIINDLHRNSIAYYSIKLLTAIFSKSELVKYDAPLSVARSLTRSEWEDIMRAAGITGYTLTWRWAWRWELVIKKQAL